jgi:hypothetical protein
MLYFIDIPFRANPHEGFVELVLELCGERLSDSWIYCSLVKGKPAGNAET